MPKLTHAHGTVNRPRRLILECLEGRMMMAADFPPALQVVASPTGDIAMIRGGAGPDRIATGNLSGDRVQVNVNGTITILPATVRSFGIAGGGGNDTIIVTAARNHVVHGGTGNDVLISFHDATRPPSSNVLRGDEGADQVFPDFNYDFYQEEPDPSEPFDVDFVGDAPWLYIRQTNGVRNNVVTVADGLITVDAISEVGYDPNTTPAIFVDLNDGADRLTNTSRTRILAYGGAGNDTLIGRRGDSLYGEAGTDLVIQR